MTESLIEKFSKLKHRGLIPPILFEQIAHYSERAALFLVKNGELQGWYSQNIPHFSDGKQIRHVQLKLDEEPDLFSSLIAGRITQFKVPERWNAYKLIEDDAQELFCLAFPFKYGTRLFGALLCFKGSEFSKDEIEKIKEAALCASEFSVILPPQASLERAAPAANPTGDLSNIQASTSGEPSIDQRLALAEVTGDEHGILRAQMLARLLVNNIKLYNEEQVILGRMKKDLRIRLKKEIEEAERFYNARVPEEIRKKDNFLEHELITNLAGGNMSALG